MKRIVVFALVLNAALLGVIAHQLVAIAGGGPEATENGDTNGDGSRDIGDAIYLLSWLFTGGAEPVALAQQGGNDEEVAQLRAMVTNMFRDFEGLREELHPVAFSGNFEELENVPAAQGGDCCEQEPSGLTDVLRATVPRAEGAGAGAGSQLWSQNFNGADLQNIDISMFRSINNCTFRNADLRGANLDPSQDGLNGIDFSGANMAGAMIGRSTSVNFEGANLQGAIFLRSHSHNCSNFRGVDLSGQVLRGSFLYSSMADADLTNADLSNSWLTGTDLTGAGLQGANLTDADLTDANIQDADFRGAIGVNFEGTIGTPAFMPNG